ncbi:MAG: transketolase family protein [Armatimonadetes bacterium]|nr:transketolase family protein [Armatimonadota bacterium]
MAKGFGDVILELSEQDPRVCGVSCDCWGFLQPLAQRFPERAIEIGIAEQNLIGIGAGLAVRGKIPFVIGMNPFVTMRCFEQIRTDLGYGARNVKVVGGYGYGLMYAGWGCTHHAMEEAALMRLIPGMTVVMPADGFETEQTMRAIAAIDGPAYFANQGGNLLPDQPEEQREFTLGKAVRLREGGAATVLSTGPIAAEALRAADELAAAGKPVRVLHVHTLKPLDAEAVLSAARETPLLVTLEEHTVIGGLGGAVAEVLAEHGCGVPLRRLGVQDVFAVMSGSHADVKRRHGISAEAVVAAVNGER